MTHNPCFKNVLVLIKGAGDLASGVAYRLKRSGFALIITELPVPLLVRRTVCFGEAVYSGEATVEGWSARRVETISEAQSLAATEVIPILVDPKAAIISKLKPQVIVDAIMAKINTGTTIHDAPLVIALGPGFTAGQDCHAVIETNRGHWLGRVIILAVAQPKTVRLNPTPTYPARSKVRPPVGSCAPLSPGRLRRMPRSVTSLRPDRSLRRSRAGRFAPRLPAYCEG